jgi:hypothetical protein
MSRLEFHSKQIFVLSLGLVLAAIYGTNAIVTLDHLAMMDRGYLVFMDDIWISYGNPSSGGLANSPGYLSTIVAGIPLLAWNSMYSPVVFLVLLQLASYLLLDDVVKRVFPGDNVRLLFVVLYWLNPWLLSLTTIWNPSYLLVLSALHLWTASRMFQSKSFFLTMLHVLSIGMAVQFHMSAFILALVSLLLFYKRLIKVNWPGFISGSAAIVLSLVPFILAAKSNWLLIEGNDYGGKYYIGRSVIHVYPVLKSILYWLRYGSLLFSSDIVFQARFEWLTHTSVPRMLATYLWQSILVFAGVASLMVSARASWLCFSKVGKAFWMPGNHGISKNGNESEKWLVWYCFCVFLAVVSCAVLSPITFNYWHLLIVFPFALMPLLMLFPSKPAIPVFGRYLYTKSFVVVLCTYLIAVNLVASHDSERFSYRSSYADQLNLQLFQLKDRR